jgi:hypothetical protein
MKTLILALTSIVISLSILTIPVMGLAACSYRIAVQNGGRMYSCYLSGEDSDGCYYDCGGY